MARASTNTESSSTPIMDRGAPLSSKTPCNCCRASCARASARPSSASMTTIWTTCWNFLLSRRTRGWSTKSAAYMQMTGSRIASVVGDDFASRLSSAPQSESKAAVTLSTGRAP